MRNTTKSVIYGTIGILLIFDVYAAMTGVENTISRVLLAEARDYPVVAFGVGFVMGHIFWPNNGDKGNA
jgi:hypothetical protein